MLIKQLKTTKSGDYERCMQIYRESFPAAERQPESVIADRIKNGTASLYVYYDDATPVGIAILYHLRHCEFILLDYLAMAASARAKGFGSIMLNHILKIFSSAPLKAKDGDKVHGYLVMEVEDPGFGENIDQRKKRIRFYQKAKAIVLKSTRYLLPPLGGATSASEMQLMIYPAPVAELSAAVINNLISQLYQQVYNRPPQDPLLLTLIN